MPYWLDQSSSNPIETKGDRGKRRWPGEGVPDQILLFLTTVAREENGRTNYGRER
jgi:hypothetical protein